VEPICDAAGAVTGFGSFLGDTSLDAHPASAKASKTTACLMPFI
jgi:hypothetical protein